MSIVVNTRLRPADIEPVMRDLHTFIEDARAKNANRCFLALVAGAFLVGAAVTAACWIDFDDEDSPIILPIGATIIAVLIYVAVNRRKWIERKAAKVTFLGQVLAGLEEDMHPRTRFRLRLDLRRYDLRTKIVGKERSSSGNLKLLYSDKWLHLDMALADHTRVELRQQVGFKTKKESIVRETRRFVLIVRPTARYDMVAAATDAEWLRKRFKEAARGLFPNPPEGFHVHVASQGTELRVRVKQEDAPILAVEVVGLIGVVMQFLSRHVRRRAA